MQYDRPSGLPPLRHWQYRKEFGLRIHKVNEGYLIKAKLVDSLIFHVPHDDVVTLSAVPLISREITTIVSMTNSSNI
jgi:hypothetical protein